MFGFSIGKFLVLAILVIGVWYLFKAMSKSNQRQRTSGPGGTDTGGRPVGMPPEPQRATSATTEDLVKCPVCSTYRPVDMRVTCGREGCPAA